MTTKPRCPAPCADEGVYASGALSESSVPELIQVRTLLGDSHVDLAIRCLGSMCRMARGATIGLVVHEDGSLTEARAALLIERLNEAGARSVRVEWKRDADARMRRLLTRRVHPRCAELREHHPLAIKLFDVPLLDEQPIVRYCDTDVLFLRPFDLRSLFQLPPERPDCNAVFMMDTADGYSPRSWEMFSARLHFAHRLNSGLMAFRRSIVELDRIEHLLKLPLRPLFRHFIEQTAYALIAHPPGLRYFDPSQARVVVDGVRLPPRLVAAHYVGTYRHLIDQVPADRFGSEKDQPIAIRTVPATWCTPRTMAGYEVRRFIHRRLPSLGLIARDAYANET